MFELATGIGIHSKELAPSDYATGENARQPGILEFRKTGIAWMNGNSLASRMSGNQLYLNSDIGFLEIRS
jgi:hypothetical protein